MVLREEYPDAVYAGRLWHVEPSDTMLRHDLDEWSAPWTAAMDKDVRLYAVGSRPVEQLTNACMRMPGIVSTESISFANEIHLSSLTDERVLLSSIIDAVQLRSKVRIFVGHHLSRYVAPQTPVADRIGEIILEEQGQEDLLLDRRQQAEWLKQVMASHWGIHLPQPFIGFDLDDGLFIASWQSDSECNTLTIDAKEHTGWYDPWPGSESDNPMPGEIDLDTEEAWERLRTALTTIRP